MFMKKMFFCYAISLLVWSSSLNAGYLQLEDERDVRRVSNNVINFYDTHYQDLIELKKENFSKESLRLQNILNNPSELVMDFINHKKAFLKEFSQVKIYVKNNKELIKEKIGKDDYEMFINGLFYIHHILRSVN